MKPAFALSLSFEGIRLLHRGAGGWRAAGDVALDDSDLTAALTGLRASAARLDPSVLTTKLIIPNEQIKYLTIDTGMADEAHRDARVREALADATPYAVDDLVYDISVEGSKTHIAAIARETLGEAEAFAVEHRFNPLSFVAIPGDQAFLGEPFFGPSAHAASLLPPGQSVESDGIAVVVVGPAEFPDGAGPAPTAQPEPEPEVNVGVADGGLPPDPSAPEPADVTPPPETETPVAGFSSRRGARAPRKEPAVTPPPAADPGPAPEPAPVVPPPVAAPRPERAEPVLSAVADDIPDMPPMAARLAGSLRADPAPEAPGEPVTEPKKPRGGFLTRRRQKRAEPAAPVVVSTVPMPPQLAAAVQRAGSQAAPALDEADQMTVFGARKGAARGKPRYLGLIMTAVLLLFLAGVAAWASIFLDDGLARLFQRDDPVAVAATEDDPAPVEVVLTQNDIAPRAIQTELPGLVAPSADTDPALRRPIDPEDPVTLAAVDPADGRLTDTDAAVLDALRAPQSPEGTAPVSPEGNEAAALYAATGIWQYAPEEPGTPAVIGLDDLYIGSIDNRELSQDAVALPEVASLQTDLGLTAQRSPASLDTRFDLDNRGLVRATPEGALNPDGILVTLGRPPIVPPATPVRFETTPETDAQQDRLAGLRPQPRPDDLAEQTERAQLGGLTREELAGARPRLRPDSLQQDGEAEVEEEATALAVATSRRPGMRPKDFAATVTAAQPAAAAASTAAIDQVAAVAPRTVKPKIPSTASVARQATLNNAINLRQVNLIGVFGTPSNRRALVRLPSGRYKKVRVGDKIDGGQISAIGDSELRYQKGGRNLVLKIPSG